MVLKGLWKVPTPCFLKTCVRCSETLAHRPGRGGGVLPSNRLTGMGRWMGSHLHDWIDYNGVAFSIGANRFAEFQG